MPEKEKTATEKPAMENIASENFETYRPLLFSIAYRLLGSASEAEDIVQEAFLRYRATTTEVLSMRSYLSAIVTRLCLDQLKSARVTREQYIGPWLPEPIVTDETTPLDTAELAESLSMAFLTLLECLSPQERAVFLLHEVFDYSYREIEEIIGENAANCRQLLHRAKERIQQRRPRFEPSRAARQQLTESFLLACQQGDMQALTSLLAQEVTVWSDGGGKTNAARRPVVGRDAVLRLIFGLMNKMPANTETSFAEVNGDLALVSWVGGTLINVICFDIADQQIQGIRIVINPDKTRFIAGQLQTTE